MSPPVPSGPLAISIIFVSSKGLCWLLLSSVDLCFYCCISLFSGLFFDACAKSFLPRDIVHKRSLQPVFRLAILSAVFRFAGFIVSSSVETWFVLLNGPCSLFWSTNHVVTWTFSADYVSELWTMTELGFCHSTSCSRLLVFTKSSVPVLSSIL